MAAPALSAFVRAPELSDRIDAMYADCAYEHCVALHFDRAHRLIDARHLSSGTETGSDLPLRQLVADALQLGSATIALIHNHPSGNPDPSFADRRITRRAAQTLAGLDIDLVDHLIFAQGNWTSLRELGVL